MTSLSRLLCALVLAICFALPGIGDEGGENGGGTGVWVLPRASFLSCTTGPERGSRTANPAMDLSLVMSEEMGSATAVFIDDLAQVPVSLQVTGLQVRLPASVMQSLDAATNPTATIMISDASHMGYLIQVVAQANGFLVLTAR